MKLSPIKKILLSYLAAWVIVIFTFILMGDSINFSENDIQPMHVNLIGSGLTLTVMILTLTNTVINHRKIRSGRWFLYPIMIFSYVLWIILIGFSYSAVYLWMLFFSLPLIFFGVPILSFIGYLIDRRVIKKTLQK
jgi:uncharacterized membrane protein YoaK (UPF0700 family)